MKTSFLEQTFGDVDGQSAAPVEIEMGEALKIWDKLPAIVGLSEVNLYKKPGRLKR